MEPGIARRGLMLVLSSPSGAGKTTIARKLRESDPGIEMPISHTTRPERNGERNGKDYFFIDRETFARTIKPTARWLGEVARVNSLAGS